jgi:predicted anti-sigma-YlaC factor YlaD
MKCEDLLTYLSDYLDQDLDEELVAAAQEHLATCQNCRVVLDTTQRTIILFRQQNKQTIPAERKRSLFDKLQQAFLQTPESPNP